jgi:hypothetical protein
VVGVDHLQVLTGIIGQNHFHQRLLILNQRIDRFFRHAHLPGNIVHADTLDPQPHEHAVSGFRELLLQYFVFIHNYQYAGNFKWFESFLRFCIFFSPKLYAMAKRYVKHCLMSSR